MAHFPLHYQVHFPKLLIRELDLREWDAYEKFSRSSQIPGVTLIFNEPAATVTLTDHSPTGERHRDDTSVIIINRGDDLTFMLKEGDIATRGGPDQKLIDGSCTITTNDMVVVRHFGSEGGWYIVDVSTIAHVEEPTYFELHQFDLLPVIFGVIPSYRTGHIHFSCDWEGYKTLELWIDGVKFYKWQNVSSGNHVRDFTMTKTQLQTLQRGQRNTYMASIELRTSDRIHWTGGLRVDIPDLAIFAPPSNSPPQ